MKQPAGEPPWPFRRRLGLIGRMLPWHRPQIRVAAVIGSDDRPLRKWANWSALMPALGTLTQRLPSKATIRPWIYPKKGAGRAVPFGLMQFNEANNCRWIEALESLTSIWINWRSGRRLVPARSSAAFVRTSTSSTSATT